MTEKTPREEAAYVAGRLDAQTLVDLYFAGLQGQGRAPDVTGGEPKVKLVPATEADALRAKLAKATEALRFYESQWRDYCGDHGVPIGHEPTDKLRNDWGDRARAALLEIEQ